MKAPPGIGIGMRRRSASSDGNQTIAISVLKTCESSKKLSGRSVAEMGIRRSVIFISIMIRGDVRSVHVDQESKRGASRQRGEAAPTTAPEGGSSGGFGVL
jgi:hypothetical protein